MKKPPPKEILPLIQLRYIDGYHILVPGGEGEVTVLSGSK